MDAGWKQQNLISEQHQPEGIVVRYKSVKWKTLMVSKKSKPAIVKIGRPQISVLFSLVFLKLKFNLGPSILGSTA